MFSKIFITTCLIYFTQGETLDEAITSLNQQVASTKTNIDLALQNDGILIRTTRATIGQTAGQAQTQLQENLNELNEQVNQAKQDAQNVDISTCLLGLDTNLGLLDWNQFHLCTQNRELDVLGTDMARLRQLKGFLSGSVSRCLATGSGNVDVLRDCVQDDIDNVNDQVQQVQTKVQEVCANATKIAGECVDKALAAAQEVIKKSANDFQQCVNGIV